MTINILQASKYAHVPEEVHVEKRKWLVRMGAGILAESSIVNNEPLETFNKYDTISIDKDMDYPSLKKAFDECIVTTKFQPLPSKALWSELKPCEFIPNFNNHTAGKRDILVAIYRSMTYSTSIGNWFVRTLEDSCPDNWPIYAHETAHELETCKSIYTGARQLERIAHLIDFMQYQVQVKRRL